MSVSVIPRYRAGQRVIFESPAGVQRRGRISSINFHARGFHYVVDTGAGVVQTRQAYILRATR